MKINSRQKILQGLTYIFAIIGIGTVVYILTIVSGGLTTTVSAQQDPFLSQRISQIEQRITSLETRLYRVEQDSRLPAVTMPRQIEKNDDTEYRLLSSQLQTLYLQLAEVECGLVKLDERTLTATARSARKKMPGDGERCRLDPNTPLEIIVRP